MNAKEIAEAIKTHLDARDYHLSEANRLGPRPILGRKVTSDDDRLHAAEHAAKAWKHHEEAQRLENLHLSHLLPVE